jgi:hypothetical protein
MLKSFRIKEENDISQIVKQEISKIIDQWVDDTLRNKIITPQMDPSKQRGLWDRFKGGLSNLWHGRNNQNNPYYWKNRFGDDMGAQESFDPSVFTLNEYSLIKSMIDETEKKINESLPADTEKLKIVKVIKQSAEELKQKLYNIFALNCPTQQQADSPTQQKADSPTQQKADSPTQQQADSPTQQQADNQPQQDKRPRSQRLKSVTTNDSLRAKVNAAKVPQKKDEPPAMNSGVLELEEEQYKNYLPKEVNKGITADELSSENQLVDTILAKDFNFEENFPSGFETKALNLLMRLKHDAEIKKEESKILEKIDMAISIIERIKNKS